MKNNEAIVEYVGMEGRFYEFTTYYGSSHAGGFLSPDSVPSNIRASINAGRIVEGDKFIARYGKTMYGMGWSIVQKYQDKQYNDSFSQFSQYG
jgi:hypothetical protein